MSSKIRTNQFEPIPAALLYELGVSPSDLEEAARKVDADNYASSVAEQKEDLTSQINGITQSFTTSSNYESGSLEVFWEGEYLHVGVLETGVNSFSLGFVPQIGETLVVRYLLETAVVPGVDSFSRFKKIRRYVSSVTAALVKLDDSVIEIDTSSGVKTLTLPNEIELASGADGVRFKVVNSGSNLLTVQGGGATINGASFYEVAAGSLVEMVYVDTKGWYSVDEEVEESIMQALGVKDAVDDRNPIAVASPASDPLTESHSAQTPLSAVDDRDPTDVTVASDPLVEAHPAQTPKDATPDEYILIYYED